MRSRTALTTTVATKVPEVTVGFWAVKVLTTGIGETSSDFLVKTFEPVVVVLVAAALFGILLAAQVRADAYRPWRYWSVVTAVSVFGTMVADVGHIVLGVPYAISSIAFALVLAVILAAWWRTERTLSIHSITTRRRELFYWATVCATFALGTAVGDLTATTLGLGYFASGLVFLALIAVPAVSFGLSRRHAVLAFWTAYVLTRPLGASFADGLAVSHARGGLDLGTGAVSLVGLVLIVAAVGAFEVAAGRTAAPITEAGTASAPVPRSPGRARPTRRRRGTGSSRRDGRY